MEYLKAVDLLKEIECKYDVMSIKYKGVSVWPVLRVYIVNKLFKDKQPQEVSSNYKLVLKTLFKYNPFVIFKNHDVWTVCSTLTRKLIGDKYVQQICGGLTELGVNMMLIEKADKVIGHRKKKDIPENDVFSMSWFYLMSFSFERILRLKNMKLEREEIIEQIISDYNIIFNYKFYVRLLISQRVVTNLFLRLSPKPKLLFIQAPYIYMGIVWAFKNHGIPVVELQHGVLNSHHYGYNPSYRSDLLMPDRICVFGEKEYNYFMSENSHFCKNVTMTGLYILEKADKYFSKDVFGKYREKYKKVIVSSGEEGREQALLTFVDEIALAHTDYLFVHIPRHADTVLSKNQENVIIVRGVNIYEYLKWCDIHMTVSSTTCLESHYFRKPNIFFNYENLGLTYYGDVLTNDNCAFYINTANEFDMIIKKINEGVFNYKELYAHNSIENIKKVLKEYI